MTHSMCLQKEAVGLSIEFCFPVYVIYISDAFRIFAEFDADFEQKTWNYVLRTGNTKLLKLCTRHLMGYPP